MSSQEESSSSQNDQAQASPTSEPDGSPKTRPDEANASEWVSMTAMTNDPSYLSPPNEVSREVAIPAPAALRISNRDPGQIARRRTRRIQRRRVRRVLRELLYFLVNIARFMHYLRNFDPYVSYIQRLTEDDD